MDSGEVAFENGRIVSFISLGSHANYPNNGDDGKHNAQGFLDRTSPNGSYLDEEAWSTRQSISSDNSNWMSYEGKWGTNGILPGADGPQGPKFLAPNFGGGVIRFLDPIEWAGIDKVGSKTVSTPTALLEYASQLARILFANEAQTGTVVSVDLHDEIISFGINIGGITPLPHFWDIESNLADNTFEANVAFQYDSDEVASLGIEENNLCVFFYNETTNLWEKVESAVNEAANSISFFTTHFSRYAIGTETKLTPEELVDALKEKIGNLNVKKSVKKNLLNGVKKLERHITKGESRKVAKDIHELEDQIKRAQRKGRIGKEATEELLSLLTALKELFLPEQGGRDRDSDDDEDEDDDDG